MESSHIRVKPGNMFSICSAHISKLNVSLAWAERNSSRMNTVSQQFFSLDAFCVPNSFAPTELRFQKAGHIKNLRLQCRAADYWFYFSGSECRVSLPSPDGFSKLNRIYPNACALFIANREALCPKNARRNCSICQRNFAAGTMPAD
jgi:hypothetical protein